MKTGFAVCIVIVAFASVQGASLRKSWFDLLPSVQETKNRVGDVWSDCSKSGDKAKINSVTITPDPPQRGQDVTVKADVQLKEELTGGEVKVSVKYGIITIFSNTLDLCTLLKDAGFTCPLAPKTYEGSLTQMIPNAIPAGHYTGNIEVTDQTGAELACINLDLHL